MIPGWESRQASFQVFGNLQSSQRAGSRGAEAVEVGSKEAPHSLLSPLLVYETP